MSVARTERVPTGPGRPPLPGCRAVLLLAAALCLWAAPPGRADDKDELAKLAGEWVVTAENEQGKSADAKDVKATHTTITFGKDGKFKLTYGSDPAKPTTAAEGSFTIKATKKPREIDLIIRTSDKEGRDIPAIYALEKDTFRIAMPNRLTGAERPTDFDGGANITVYVCRRK
jgi:uncharacterized protein (TIGR03067 family)